MLVAFYLSLSLSIFISQSHSLYFDLFILVNFFSSFFLHNNLHKYFTWWWSTKQTNKQTKILIKSIYLFSFYYFFSLSLSLSLLTLILFNELYLFILYIYYTYKFTYYLMKAIDWLIDFFCVWFFHFNSSFHISYIMILL